MEKFKTDSLKTAIKHWIIEIEKTEKLPGNIVALCFNLYEPYGLELVGSTLFDEEDEDWACQEDFRPQHRQCPDLSISEKLGWEDVLNAVVAILKELIVELTAISLFSVKHIAAGFVDGDLIIIK